MVRLSGVDLPNDKRVEIALTYIFGVGLNTSQNILRQCGIDFNIRVKNLSESELLKIREALAAYVVEGDLRRQVQMNVKRLMEIGSYRGSRHKRKLPVRGQRTHTNARTKKGRRVAIAGKKKVTK